MPRQDIRNVAIIAHVDHGKTTLVDAMLLEVTPVTYRLRKRALAKQDRDRLAGQRKKLAATA